MGGHDPGFGHQVEQVGRLMGVQTGKLHGRQEFLLKSFELLLESVQGVVAQAGQIVAIEFRKQGLPPAQVGAVACHGGAQGLHAEGKGGGLRAGGGLIGLIAEEVRPALLAFEEGDPALGSHGVA